MPSAITFCYALTSGPDDTYADMAYISVSALRRLHPDARIVLLTDATTARLLKRKEAPLCKAVDQYLPVECDMKAGIASRFIKTQQRQLVSGDFLFVDVDAIPVRPLSDLFEQSPSFAAVLDVNPYKWNDPVPDFVRQHFHSLEWTIPLTPYLNSGVLYWSASEEAQRLGEEWHRCWLDYWRSTGNYIDQPALFRALCGLRLTPTVLGSEYNFLLGLPMDIGIVGLREHIAHRRRLLKNARIWHFAGASANRGTVLAALVAHLQKTGEINWPMLDRAVQEANPWIDPGNRIERHLYCGNYLKAALLWLRQRKNLPE